MTFDAGQKQGAIIGSPGHARHSFPSVPVRGRHRYVWLSPFLLAVGFGQSVLSSGLSTRTWFAAEFFRML